MSGTLMFKCNECHKGYLIPHIECSMNSNRMTRYYKCNKCNYKKSF